MFLMIADMMATMKTSSGTCSCVELRREPSLANSRSMMRERATAALSTSALPTMMTMSSEKPLKASAVGTNPSATPSSSASIATMS